MPKLIDHHQGVLPHHQELNQVISINWRLAFTLPRELLDILQGLHELSREFQDHPDRAGAKEIFQKDYALRMQLFDEYLGKCRLGGIDLCKPALAEIIARSIAHYAATLYELHAWCLLPNHLHLLIRPLPDAAGTCCKTSAIVKKLKTFTTKEINLLLGREGQLWQHEYYDRYIRDPADYYRTVNYYLNNPVKAGFVKKPEDWAYSWYQPGLIEQEALH